MYVRRKQQQQQPADPESPVHLTTPDSVHGGGVQSLIGGCGGISLDGRSVQFDNCGGTTGADDDEVSSINSSVYRACYHPETGAPDDQVVIVSKSPPTTSPNGAVVTQEDEPLRMPSAPSGLEILTDLDRTTVSIEPVIHDDSKNANGNRGGGPNKRGCLPLWIRRAPVWLKFVFAMSMALLVGASVLIAVGLTLALGDDNETTSSRNQNGNIGDPPVTPRPPTVIPPTFLAPAASPVAATLAPTTVAPTGAPSSTTDTPTSVPTTSAPSTAPIPLPTTAPFTLMPSTPPSFLPTVATSVAPTVPPTVTVSEQPSEFVDTEILTFYVTAGRLQSALLDDIPSRLAQLPVRTGFEFLVHAGDWNSPFGTGCDEASFQEVAQLFSHSTIPVYFVVGDNEYNDCPDPEQAIQFWRQTLVDYEEMHWPTPTWTVWRQEPDYTENWVFDYNDSIVVSGVNLVGGTVHDPDEWETRQDDLLDWIRENYRFYRRRYQVFCLFLHAAPPGGDQNGAFYTTLLDRIEREYDEMHWVLIHRNDIRQANGITEDYLQIPHLDVISVLGAQWPPLQVQVDPRVVDQPVTVDVGDWWDNLPPDAS